MQKTVAIPLTVIAGLIFWFNVGLYPYLIDFLIIPIGSLVAILSSIICITELVKKYRSKFGIALFFLNLFFAVYPMWLLVNGSSSYSIP